MQHYPQNSAILVHRSRELAEIAGGGGALRQGRPAGDRDGKSDPSIGLKGGLGNSRPERAFAAGRKPIKGWFLRRSARLGMIRDNAPAATGRRKHGNRLLVARVHNAFVDNASASPYKAHSVCILHCPLEIVEPREPYGYPAIAVTPSVK